RWPAEADGISCAANGRLPLSSRDTIEEITEVNPVSHDELSSSVPLVCFCTELTSGGDCMPDEHKELDRHIMERNRGVGEPWRASAQGKRKHSSNGSSLIPVVLEKQVTLAESKVGREASFLLITSFSFAGGTRETSAFTGFLMLESLWNILQTTHSFYTRQRWKSIEECV
ncbi:hypothetical protein B296_00043734, partial [Ensete ventricosum]